MAKRRPMPDRFWSKVDRRGPDDCWPWTAALTGDGYGRIRGTSGQRIMAHRLAYELSVGPIPDGLTIDHLCRVRACCNPAHLEPVTNRENIRRGEGLAVLNAAKTHCPQGHPYDEANTQWVGGMRKCRICNRAYDAERRRARNGRMVDVGAGSVVS
jgi:hypothetical protein